RDIATLERELDLYPDDASVWAEPPGLPNPAGTLFLHLAGSLQHFFGAALGGLGYVRDRDAEFRQRGLPRADLRAQLAAARRGVEAAFGRLGEADLDREFPVRFADAPFSTRLTLLQFASHLAYHLGQIDYHRRVVTGQNTPAGAMSAMDLVG
ncbi:MAG TPA: DinB family protein, partial [Deinococcales bacterium]|nr:DinB family protein [Deinococcales bacterium]